MVTNIETLPPHYEMPLERLREENEEVSHYGGRLEYWNGYQGCPFCGRRKLFVCSCGYLSCRGVDERPVHTCPKCRRTQDTEPIDKIPMSKSGLVHGNAPQELPRGEGPPSVGMPDRKKEIALKGFDKFLKDQAKKQLEDKRNKD